MFPEAKLGIGPPITDGFYYDFDVPRAFTPEDLEALEKRMRQIVKEGQLFSRRVYESKDQAREELANEPYKLELVDDKSGDPEVMEVGGDELTAYDNLNPRTREREWGDLCRGPHIPDDALHSGVQADPQLGRLLARRPGQREPAAHLRHGVGVAGGARQATSSSSRRRSAATTASSVRSSTCSASPTKSVRGWRFSTPRAESSAANSRTTRGASTARPATSSSTARTSPRRSCSRSRATWTGTPTACSRRCTSTRSTTRTARCASPARTTTSSR